jgi:acyl-CoA reductase-like NAD-dependent aldehyde dehydrogenase
MHIGFSHFTLRTAPPYVRENRMQQAERAMATGYLEGVRLAQREWAATSLSHRLGIVRELRRRMASGATELAETIPTHLPGALSRTVADSLVAEVLPLIEACRFLEREAVGILQPKNLGTEGRPVWLGGVEAEVERAPWGVVLILGPANYPLLLAGVQALQALAAGNAVLWKPAPGTAVVALALQALLVESGLHPELLTVLDPSVESATEAIAAGVDYVVLTGSAETGKAVLRQLAETLTPAAMELSGCDAVFVLPGADIERTVQALAFGLRFNGSFTCMAPRRVFLVGAVDDGLEGRLAAELGTITPVAVTEATARLLRGLIEDAREQGAEILLDGIGDSSGAGMLGVTLIAGATPALRSMQAEIFAPVLSVMRARDLDEVLTANAACPYALTASIFGPEKEARLLAGRLQVGNVLINDIVIPTADPRIAFGGRGRSGFGVTRGAEGLLAMTTPRTIQIQRRFSRRVYEATGDGHVGLFASLAEVLHGGGVGRRLAGLRRMVGATWRLR